MSKNKKKTKNNLTTKQGDKKDKKTNTETRLELNT